MRFFEDSLAALGRAIDRSVEAVARALGLSDRLSRPSSSSSAGVADWFERKRDRLRYAWALTPERDRRRWTAAGFVTGAFAGAVLVFLLARVWTGTPDLTDHEQALIDSLVEKIQSPDWGGSGGIPLFPGAR